MNWRLTAAVAAVVTLGLGFGLIRSRQAVRATTKGGTVNGSSSKRLPIILDDRRRQLTGVRTTRVTTSAAATVLRGTGSVAYDEARLVDVNLKLDGWIRDLLVASTGQRVTKGQALLTLFSPELLAVQTQYLAALKNRDQLPASPGGSADLADRILETPRQRLVRWDVPEDQIQALEARRELLPAVTFRSPGTGVVIEKNAIQGMHVESGRTLFKLADLTVVWVEAEFRESDLSSLRAGGRAEVAVEAWPGETFTGRILNVLPYLTPETRTLRARIELQNPEGRLKPGMLASVELSGAPRKGLWVPADAVVDSGRSQTVFVVVGDGNFEPRSVVVGGSADGQVLILDGIREQEEIATRAVFFLDSESRTRTAFDNYGPTGTAPSSADGLDVSVGLIPDPPRIGENVVEVRIEDTTRRPATDLEVRVLFSMPSMPAMNMPAMRAEARPQHVGSGVYRGAATITMAGRWDVTVTALRSGRAVATRNTTVVAR